VSPPAKGRAPARLCRGCLAVFVPRVDGAIPEHRLITATGERGAPCRGAGRPPRESGYGRSHHVIT
jgi:hypothetical protein